MTLRKLGFLLVTSGLLLFIEQHHHVDAQQKSGTTGAFRPDLETRLQPLAVKLAKPRPGEWRYEHPEEKHESFDQYVRQQPVRKSDRLTTIYLCLLGEFNKEQQQIIDANREYLEIFFQTPVKIFKRVTIDQIPARARRRNPQSGNPQILSLYVLDELLLPQRPRDALAYVAFSASDLWTRDRTGRDWNFVFGQAQLRDRVGVWSLARFPNPATDRESYLRCLRLTLGTASHETCHILTMPHCSEYVCSLNGSNHLEESESKPLRVCPSCFRKLCWNLRLEPVDYCRKLGGFFERQGLTDEAEYCRKAVEALQRR